MTVEVEFSDFEGYMKPEIVVSDEEYMFRAFVTDEVMDVLVHHMFSEMVKQGDLTPDQLAQVAVVRKLCRDWLTF